MDNNKEVHVIKLPIEVFVEIAPKMLTHLVESMYRVMDIATVQQNVAILEVINESSKYVENLLLSYVDVMKDMQDEQQDNTEGT